jgi:hypothetical protein
MAAMFDQSRNNNYNINSGSVQVKAIMTKIASNTTNCSAALLPWDDSYFSSSSVLPLLQPSPEVSLNQSNENHPIDPRKVIFFHLHEAKTAGSSLNRYLARRYHAVCGNKGYSFNQLLHIGTEPWKRGRERPHMAMEERGFYNCRLISHELSTTQSLLLIRQLQQEPYGFYVHVLIPCRDAISHRISICAHKKIKTQNWTDTLDDEELCGKIISRCNAWGNRYNTSYETVANQVTYFWYKNFTQLDRLLDPYVPQRGYPLPEANQVYQTNTRYPSDFMEEVTRRCTTRVNQHNIENEDIFKQCAKHVPEVHLQYF